MKEINYVTYFAQSLGGKHTANGKLHVYETFIKDGNGRSAPLHSYYNVNDKGAVIDAYFDISDVASLLENGSPDSVIADIKRPGGFDFVGTRNYNGHTCIYADLSDHRISPNYDHVSQAASWLMIVHKIFARRYGGSSREQNMVDADLKSWSAESAEKKGKNLTRMGLISLIVCIASAIVASVASLPWLTAVSVITWWTFLIPLILGFMKKGDAKGIRANKFSFPAPGGRASSPAPAPKPASSPRPAPSPRPAAPSQSVSRPEEFTYAPVEDSPNQYEIKKYNGHAEIVKVPSSYKGKKVSQIGISAFEGNTSMKTLILPSSLFGANNLAFYNCTNLTKVEIPEGVVAFGSGAFACCSSLREITLPRSIEMLAGGTFMFCDNLTVHLLGGVKKDFSDEWDILDPNNKSRRVKRR